jgi:beta-galactosidase
LNIAIPVADRIKKKGGLILVMSSGEQINPILNNFLPAKINVTERQATALESNLGSVWGKFFRLPDLYFAEQEGDRYILKHGLSGELVEKGTIVLQASRTNWALFNNTPENRKCAQVVLYEHLKKPEGVALVTYRLDNATLAVSALDYSLDTKETLVFWKNLFAAMKINTSDSIEIFKEIKQKPHDLLLDGPVD